MKDTLPTEAELKVFLKKYESFVSSESRMWANGEMYDTPQKGNGSLGETLICPVCGKTVFECWGDYDICEICGWYNDGIQYNDHDYEGGCNKKSVNQLRKEWLEKQNNLKNV